MTAPATLQALAYLYIAFAHATDEALTTDEMRTLSDRLMAWTADTGAEPVGAALEGAVAAYQAEPTARDKLARALAHAKTLASALSQEEQTRVLEDLQSIADADGEVSREERSMMDAVAKVLGIG